ncbi:hypothetical protein ACN4EE_08655 [Geminocystis sp. CENA526]|uniref:hypothetical protein n=1 Tax=Geminocystis sp. CENA526 TaxID=1355871 RepID=UPI003D6EB1B3
MSKRNRKPSQPKPPNYTKISPPSESKTSSNSSNSSNLSVNTTIRTTMVQPEQMSLTAHQHIQTYLNNRLSLEEKDLTAILRLSTHLRVFGLLSAVGYINQSNDQQGEVRLRTVPVWRSLLGQMLMDNSNISGRDLMNHVQTMARENPTEYMVMWRKSLTLSQYWNFWGRAYTNND